MHESTFADVACPAQHVVLNLPLLDFTLGHRLLLSRARNPLLGLDEAHFNSLPFEKQTAALIEAAFICAQPFSEYRAMESAHCPRFKRWQLRRQVNAWHRSRRRSEKRFIRHITRAPGPDTPSEAEATFTFWSFEIASFRNYLAQSRINTDAQDYASAEESPSADHRLPCLTPEKTEFSTTGSNRGLGAPYDAILIQFLLHSGLCRSEAECMDYPFALAEVHYLTHLEKEGCLRIMNAAETDFADDCISQDLIAARAAGFNTVKEHFEHVLAEAQKKRAQSETKNPPAGLATSPPPELSTINQPPSTSP